MAKKKKNPHIGSTLDDLLASDGNLEKANAIALKRKVTFQIEKEMKANSLSKQKMAEQMKTSRSALDRLLDPDNTSVTLNTMSKAARVVGKKLKMELVDA